MAIKVNIFLKHLCGDEYKAWKFAILLLVQVAFSGKIFKRVYKLVDELPAFFAAKK